MKFDIDKMKGSFKEKKSNIDLKNINMDTVIAFVKKNTRETVAGVLIFILFIMLFVGSCGSANLKNPNAGNNMNYVISGLTAKGGANGDYKVNSNKQINNLIRSYFNNFADGKVDELEKLITPLDENQKNLVIALSEYIESYQNLAIYYKDGPVKDSYMVSVYHETKFKDIKTRAPGLTTFYIKKNDNGQLVIDNRPESALEPEVIEYLNVFKGEDDVIELANLVNVNSAEAFKNDATLYDFVVNTYQKVYTDYYAAVQAAADAAAAQAAAEAQAAADAAAAQAAAEAQAAADAAAAQAAADAQAAAAAQPQTPAIAAGTTVYANDMVNIRKEATTNSGLVGMTNIGEAFTVVEVSGDWIKIKTSANFIGFVKAEFLQTTKP